MRVVRLADALDLGVRADPPMPLEIGDLHFGVGLREMIVDLERIVPPGEVREKIADVLFEVGRHRRALEGLASRLAQVSAR